MHVDRFKHLITVLENVKTKHLPFDLSDWAGDAPDVDAGEIPVEHVCGTSACACGYAGLDAEFQKQGFFLMIGSKLPGSVDEFNVMMKSMGDSFYDAASPFYGVATPHFKGEEGDEYDGWDAVTTFFGVNTATAERLFGGGYNDETPDVVINRINKLLELNWREFIDQRRNGEIA